MTARGHLPAPSTARHRRSALLRDEVYRQMFLLEEGRQDAETGLALALLRAWLALDEDSSGGDEREWLKKISPICVEMIEEALQKHPRPRTCLHPV
ncbi:MAG: hypothetical protein ACP5FH_06250 [Terracidiphilus sp.]